MMMKSKMNIMMTLATGVALLWATGSLSAQPLAVGTAGAKTVTLNDKVGKNQFTWTSEAPLEKIKGTCEGVTGSLTLDPKNIAATRGTVSAQVATMKSGNASRDGHIRGNQWLNAGSFPTISFSITSVGNVKVSGNSATGTATGRFTMHGVTKTIAVPFKLTYVVESAATQKRAPGDLVMMTADFDLKLADFNVTGAKGLIGSTVGETIKISAQLYGSTGG